MRDRTAGLGLIAGAGVYAALVGAGNITFNSTPLLIGATALVAGVAGRRRRLVPIGLALAGWGAAVLLVSEGPLPANRSAPAYLVGMSIGLLAAQAVARAWRIPITGALITALTSGIAFYLAYDIEALGDWPLWTAALLVWGVIEVIRASDTA